MRAYVGQTRSQSLIGELSSLGIGEIIQRCEYPPRRQPWVADNGAFRDWRSGAAFDARAYRRLLESISSGAGRPDWLLLPDIVAGGQASLEYSLGWLDECAGVAPCYLAVQDGMTEADVTEAVDSGAIAGLFVGGTLRWKLATGGRWVAIAKRLGLRCHIGRVGSARRVRWAASIGADSIDSSLPLWSKAHLRRFVEALDSAQLALDPESMCEALT